jgi:hypothetical protein
VASQIEILRAVATSCGVRPPTDTGQDNSFLRTMLPIWDEVVNDFATRHAWTWGTDTRTITASSDTPPAPWVYSYPLPVDRTLIRELTDAGGLPLDYDIEGQRILCNDPGPLLVRINTAVTPDYWPADFARCIRMTLEGYCWKGLRDDYNRGQKLIEDVDPPKGLGYLQKAITRDKRQRPARKQIRGTVYSAFRGGVARRRELDG